MNQNGSGFLNSIPAVTKNLIIINLLLWVASLVFLKWGVDLTQLLGLHLPGSQGFWPHQFITYMFMHDTHSLSHVFFNMFAVYMFGRVLENVWGSKRFLTFYMVSGIGAGLINLLVIYIRLKYLANGLPPEAISDLLVNGAEVLHQGMNYSDPVLANLNLLMNQTTVGASGAVFGILLAFGMLFPNVPLFLMFIPIPIKAKYFVLGYGLVELFLGFSNPGDNVAHFAHLGGMLFGFFMIRYWKKKDAKNGRYFY
ncbi:rhomboid family intramembrane serine protease [Parabacteroides sp. 52]|uniref:rhomboid family intramembrane serine protease n=1 Tax=unclassified Parabacteroides TaxID=2649774 RepID=UPI0013D6D855|nr:MULTISPECIES: rhomboid family intramembrane serine protease [unclassified Parabacteroides]MDH6535530.1 membrane associated rhomboid family serine protease [Parabacteroides sp. PM5-20]NDV56152.1 rhomboid family intramembrane serine protease [Parabacteroides sp. 52]